MKLKVYYDGLCKVCSKEITHYKRQNGADQIEFLDICSPGFNPADEGMDPLLIHKKFHARRQDGTIITGVDAFIEIWSLLPKYRWLAKIALKKPIKLCFELGYIFFTLIRPYLPKYKNSTHCKDSPYCEFKNE